jgi:uncharacterized protein YdaU (DUF1376 family)
MKNPWVSWYPGDYLSKTRHLTQGQHGVYTLLLWEYYVNGPIRARAEQVLNICSAHEEHEKANVTFVLEEFFVLKGGKYHHARADEELARMEDIREKRVKAGKARQHMFSTSSAHAEQMPTQPQPHIKPKNLEGGGSSNGSKAPPPKFNQDDFDERDWRVISAAKKKILDRLKGKIGYGQSVTDAEYLEAIAEESGVTPKKVMQLHEKMGVHL